jgi:hypothetical protein
MKSKRKVIFYSLSVVKGKQVAEGIACDNIPHAIKLFNQALSTQQYDYFDRKWTNIPKSF